MPFLDHLEELRWRILKSLLVIVVATLVGWFIVQSVDVIAVLKRPIAPLLPGGRLVFTSPTEPFLITLKFAFVVGLLFASPFVIYQAWAFLAPALYDRERRVIVPALSVGVVLFLLGAGVAYEWVLPRALAVLFSFQRSDLAPIITADNYFGFAAQIMIAFGLVTELPLVVVILAALGLVTPQFLAHNRRYALVIAALAAALLTPPDAVSMLLMMVPLVLLYEVSIWCAWVVTRRRARRAQAAARAGIVLLALCGLGAGRLAAQGAVPRPRRPVSSRPDTTPRAGAPGTGAPQGQSLDTAAARRLGLPTGPTRSFPPSDAVMDSLLKLKGYRVTQYVADTLVVQGDSQTIFLRGESFVDRQGTKLEADSIRYRDASCRLDAAGDPRLFDQGTVLVGEGMRYDTCIRRGTVRSALTTFQQGGATWYTRGDLAVDSGSTRVYGASSEITSSDLPMPDYHFAAHEVKWLNKNVMVARPAVLYIRDVPILWLPFIFQDIRPGRRSGILVPRFGLNDLVRPTRSYQRHVANLGYYWVLGNYADLLLSGDWYASRYVSLRAQTHYRWLDRFLSGSFSYSRVDQLDAAAHSSRFGWQHQQSFSSRTRFNASIDYATSASVIQTNAVDPYVATAQLTSQVNFDKRFDWGTLNVGGSRSQNLANDLVNQNFPRLSLTPSPVNITPSITWSPGFSFNNAQNFHVGPTFLLAPGTGGAGVDTLRIFSDTRQTDLSLQTPLRVGRWTWSNSVSVSDQISNARQEFLIPDSTVPGGVRHLLYGQTFATAIDWQTGINLPPLFTGTWKLQPGVSVVNTTSAGPFMIRNQFSDGRFVRQGKRLQFAASMSPTFFGFFPGIGPLERIRHSLSPLISYRYAPGAQVSAEFARVLDPTGQTLNARTDPQQTISVGLSQNIEAKLRRSARDTSAQATARKIRLLGINTDAVSYNFEQAKQPGRTGWQTQSIGNTFASDLLPGFSLRTTHDLWDGPVGLATSEFSPFLTSLTASFSVSPATIRGIARLFGLAKQGEPSATPPATGSGTPPPPPAYGQSCPPVCSGAAGGYRPGRAGGGGRGFGLAVGYTSSRTRPPKVTTPGTGAFLPSALASQRQATLNMNFSPTALWTASWSTLYDLNTRQFGQHYVRLERDLRRWHASFAFVKSPNGNFAFNFYVALIDQPDIKFDYEQQSLQR
ncbi:MAG: twin-arginine translocase subunit TatC [Gemmatimonadetes bacterium]|nr:MAG: twin-arginine translocase subunit TatC [Gemmatimonadota bacterium]